MGLDITPYSGLKKLDCHFDKDGDPIDPRTGELIGDYLRPYRNADFPGRVDDLEDGAVYSYEAAGPGWGGGYGYYNRLRETLAKMAGYPLTEYHSRCSGPDMAHAAACWQGQTGPFCELIDFTDCDGTIGTAVSAKLAKDFQEWDERAKAEGEHFYEFFTAFREAFEMASDGGAVRFH